MILSIIVPCYNEAKNIPLLLDRFNEVIKCSDIEVLLVNNGSTDESSMIMNELIPKYSFARSVTVKVNQGYGYGILSGLNEARGNYIGWTHADLQTDPYDSIKALDVIEGRNCPVNIYLKGKRKGRHIFDVFFTVGMGVFESLYLKAKLWDVNAQPNIFHRSFFEIWKDPPHDFSLDLYALYMAKKKGLEIIRFPVLFPERIHGQSSWNTSFKMKWKFIKRTLDYSARLKKEIDNGIYSS